MEKKVNEAAKSLGKMGGEATKKKHGKGYFREIALKRWKKEDKSKWKLK